MVELFDDCERRANAGAREPVESIHVHRREHPLWRAGEQPIELGTATGRPPLNFGVDAAYTLATSCRGSDDSVVLGLDPLGPGRDSDGHRGAARPPPPP